jgi:hypothetical protein
MYIIFRSFSYAKGSSPLKAIIVFPEPFGATSKVFFLDFESTSISFIIFS